MALATLLRRCTVTRTVLSILLSVLLTLSVAAQQTSTSNTQPLILLQRSLSALSGGGWQALSRVPHPSVLRVRFLTFPLLCFPHHPRLFASSTLSIRISPFSPFA